jgi:GNAT superfamily N-acetyltransferase
MGSGAAAQIWRTSVIDPHDDSQFWPWFEAVEAARERLWPDEPGWQALELRSRLVLEDAHERCEALVALDADGAVVGTGWIELAQQDNTHLAMVELSVVPAARRQGVGSALLATIEELTVAEGRTVVAAWQDEPVPQRGRSAGRSFAVHHGYDMVQANFRRDLRVPIDPQRRASLEAECAANAVGYHAEVFTGPWPDRWMDDRIEFGVRMSTDTPRADFARDDEVWDVARVREVEAVIAASDRLHLSAVVVHEATGRLAGFSQLAVPRGAPSKAYQWDTLVLSEHRGHRLGTLVKLANLAQLAEESPETSVVVTYNASENDPMIRVNEALGCVVMANGLTWQKHVA